MPIIDVTLFEGRDDATKRELMASVTEVVARTLELPPEAVTLVLRRSLAGYVADPDAFYHMAHAARYGSGSPFDTAFPWARFSVIE